MNRTYSSTIKYISLFGIRTIDSKNKFHSTHGNPSYIDINFGTIGFDNHGHCIRKYAPSVLSGFDKGTRWV